MRLLDHDQGIDSGRCFGELRSLRAGSFGAPRPAATTLCHLLPPGMICGHLRTRVRPGRMQRWAVRAGTSVRRDIARVRNSANARDGQAHFIK